jgi:hypothetical protein
MYLLTFYSCVFDNEVVFYINNIVFIWLIGLKLPFLNEYIPLSSFNYTNCIKLTHFHGNVDNLLIIMKVMNVGMPQLIEILEHRQITKVSTLIFDFDM